MRRSLLLLLFASAACRWPLFDQQEQPSVVSISLALCPSGEVTSLHLLTIPDEGDWSYAPFTGVRLEDMKVATAEGAAVALGAPAFTPDETGGEVVVPLLDLPPDAQTVQVEGSFVASMQDGGSLPIGITGTARPGTPARCASTGAR